MIHYSEPHVQWYSIDAEKGMDYCSKDDMITEICNKQGSIIVVASCYTHAADLAEQVAKNLPSSKLIWNRLEVQAENLKILFRYSADYCELAGLEFGSAYMSDYHDLPMHDFLRSRVRRLPASFLELYQPC